MNKIVKFVVKSLNRMLAFKIFYNNKFEITEISENKGKLSYSFKLGDYKRIKVNPKNNKNILELPKYFVPKIISSDDLNELKKLVENELGSEYIVELIL